MAESLQGDDHSTLISAAFTISDHFRVCAAMNTANFCGDPSFGFAEILSRFTCIPGDLTISLIADEGDGPSGVGLGLTASTAPIAAPTMTTAETRACFASMTRYQQPIMRTALMTSDVAYTSSISPRYERRRLCLESLYLCCLATSAFRAGLAGRDRLQLAGCASWQASSQAAFRRQGRSFFSYRFRRAWCSRQSATTCHSRSCSIPVGQSTWPSQCGSSNRPQADVHEAQRLT